MRHGAYHDSVTLLQVSRDITALDGVDEAVVAMGTELNVSILADLGFEGDGISDASPNDLIVAVRADDDETVDAALAAVERALADSSGSGGDGGDFNAPPPHTIGQAARQSELDLALISVPGEHAFVEAMDALRAGMHVMLFSDNVPLDQEIALKTEGRRRGLLVMGPDCGTAIVGGVGLGFANVVRPGPVGVVAASGTGAQQLCCLLDEADVGLRHVLGVGGRDLLAEVGGASTLQALEALDADASIELIVVVSKPPDPDVAERVREAAQACATPVVLGFVGRGERDLTAVAEDAAKQAGSPMGEHRRWEPDDVPTPADGALRGLFSGGTLCDEAMVIAAESLGAIRSNIPLEPEWALDDTDDAGHVMIDFGEDDMTQGRPHPMIDHSLRVSRLEREARRPGSNVLLMDVVLGHGADDDPAAALAPAIADARRVAADRGDRLAVVVSLCGTRDDPQDRDGQAMAFADAGAIVHLSNAQAARDAVRLVSGGAA
ncbi:MAG: acyl-CoA synthetase FdrA [Actinobacteria bacterium]|nr:acyl-CoA synthetase FdrA [Actinomycetota bacterium]